MGTVLLTHDAQGRPAIVEFDGVKYGYVHNLQGDIVAIIDDSGNQVVEYTNDAWGKPLTRTGTLASTLGYWSPFRYRGYVYDEETGLYYLRSRYYNPVWGRFVNEDSQCGEVGTLFSNNLFSYCRNSWIGTIDTEGQKERTISGTHYIGDWLVTNREIYEPYEKAAKDYKNFKGKDLQVNISAINDRGIIYTPKFTSISYTTREKEYRSIIADVPGICFAISENSSYIGDGIQSVLIYYGINVDVSDIISAEIQVATEIIAKMAENHILDSHSYNEHVLKIDYLRAWRSEEFVFSFTSCGHKFCNLHRPYLAQ